jgi:hypothetical protein
MTKKKKPWRGIAIDADGRLDDVLEGEKIGYLVVKLAPDRSTPMVHIGREIHVPLYRPMLELLAQIAEDTGAVEYVMPLALGPDDL